MNKLPYLILILTILASCKNELELKPKYSDFKTDLEARGLFGKVKKFSQFRAGFKDVDGNQLEKPVPNLKEEFTSFGSVKKMENFDSFGKSQQITVNFYDENNYLVKYLTTNKNQNLPQKIEETIEHDSVKNKKIRNITMNDSIHYVVFENYGKFDQIQKQVMIENGDTITRIFEYKFNDNNKIVWQKETKIDTILSDYNINEYKYNSDGNMIVSIQGNEWLKFKMENEFEGGYLTKSKEYTITADLKENLREEIEYDKYYNPTNQKIYENSKLNRELKNEYKFDGKGNWTEKKVSLKEHFANSNKFIPIYIESRKIKYWE